MKRNPAKASKTKKKTAPAKPPASASGLNAVFDQLQRILSHHAPPFKATSGDSRGRRHFHLAVPKPVVIPGAYGGEPTNLSVADLMMQTGFVGFYFMPIYIEPALKKHLSPALLKLLKGKTCFHIKAITPELAESLKTALDLGTNSYREKGWI
jgi:hypothetical protein